MNELWIAIAGFFFTILVTTATTTWTLAKIKEQLSNEVEQAEKRLSERISNLEKQLIRFEGVAELNKEKIERIQGIFELKINSINLEIEKLERKMGAIRAEIDKRLTLRKPDS
jgi:predicted ribosome quality control (RQC) complex YloA/Tae2 family protein